MRAVADDVWVIDEPSHTMFGMHLGARATVVRLGDGGVLLHSPVQLTPERQAAVEGVGPVQHIVAPNLYHHLFVGPWAEAHPDAQVHGVRGLAKKRPDLKFDTALTETPIDGLADTFAQVEVPSMLGETVFLHRPSKTIIACDFFENFTGCDHWATRAYLKAAGIWQKPGVSRLLRPMFRDRRAARDKVDQILAWDFDRVVIAHGDVVQDRPRETVLASYEWL